MEFDKENNSQRPVATKKPVRKKENRPALSENVQSKTKHVQETQDKEKLQNLVQQWRAERQARLMSRLMKKTGHVGFSKALLGTVPASEEGGQPALPKRTAAGRLAPKPVDPAVRRSTVHAFGVQPDALKTPKRPARTILSLEERRSTIHAFTAKLSSAPSTLRKKPGGSSVDPNKQGGSSVQPNKPGGSSVHPNKPGGSSVHPIKPGGSSIQPNRLGTSSSSRPAKENAGKEAPKSTNTKGKPKPFVVRHTLASRMRLEKANPILGLTLPIRAVSAPVGDAVAGASNGDGAVPGPSNVNGAIPGPSNARHLRSVSVPGRSKSDIVQAKNPSKAAAELPRKTSVASHVVPMRPIAGPSNTRRPRTSSVPAVLSKTPAKTAADNPSKTPVASHIVQKRQTLGPTGSSQKKMSVSAEKSFSGRKMSKQYDAVSARVSSRPSTVRRSLSSTYLDRLGKSEREKYVIRSQSEPNVNEAEEVQSGVKFLPGMPSPISEEPTEASPKKTPRSVIRMKKSVTFVTPMGNSNEKCYTPEPEVLRKRLMDWLTKRGKSLDSYHHLNCFGIHAKSMEHSRYSLPRPRTPMPPRRLSTTQMSPDTPVNLNETVTLSSEDSTPSDALKMDMETEVVSPVQRSPLAAIPVDENVTTSTPHNSPMADVMNIPVDAEDKENVTVAPNELFIPDTLGDLYKLIQLGYPRDQCDEWLVLIRRANKGITDLPQYWECLAALEEARGDIGAAIDCYGRAVVRGAETTKIEASLEVLWDKFSALNITNTPRKTPTRRKTLDPKQVFTSSIIKFALQQRAVKRLSSDLGVEAESLNYVLTPVRRSTRKSTSQFRSTPSSQVFSKLEEIAPGVLEAMKFRKNSALEPRE